MAEATAVGSEQIQATIEGFFSALSRLDFTGAAGQFASDAVVEDPKGSGTHSGSAAITEFYNGLGGLLEKLDIGADRVYTSGDGAAAVWTARYTGRNGRSGEISGIDVYTFASDGRFASLVAYWDAAAMIADVTA